MKVQKKVDKIPVHIHAVGKNCDICNAYVNACNELEARMKLTKHDLLNISYCIDALLMDAYDDGVTESIKRTHKKIRSMIEEKTQ